MIRAAAAASCSSGSEHPLMSTPNKQTTPQTAGVLTTAGNQIKNLSCYLVRNDKHLQLKSLLQYTVQVK